MLVKTRFAPSPTGFLHIGNIRTALFSWLYARHHQGEFILRIEDTDQERSTQEAVQAILDGMAWLGINYDQGPFYQTKRYDRYLEIANQLLEQGSAYRCVCSKERLETLRIAQLAAKQKPRYDEHCREKNLPATTKPHVLRFKNPKTGSVAFLDQVYGDIQIANDELDDLILLRSDNYPTYNFAVVIDDWDMGITHVIRGDDHINNTPRQINLFKALNAPIPIFAHLPTILGDDGKRLSKRHGAVSVLQFRDQGILPHALLNYLVRLGWSYGDQEIFSVNDMIQYFNLKNISRGVACFDYNKLYWLNQHYIKSDPAWQVGAALRRHCEQMGIDITNGPNPEDVVAAQADRCKTLVDMCEKSAYFYQDDIVYDEDAVKKHLRPIVLEPLIYLYEQFLQEKNWDVEHMQQIINEVSTKFNLNMSKVGQPLRVAITGTSVSPAIDTTLVLLGKTKTLSRLNYALTKIHERIGEIQ